jgi:hypothetical protein
MPFTEDIHSICMSPFNKLPTKRFIVIVAALTGVIGCFGGPITVLRKVSDKEYEQRSDRVCS